MQKVRELMGTSGALPLGEKDLAWLQMLLSEWQVIADMGSADLVLWLPTEEGRFVAAGLARSATASTLHVDDVIGLYAPAAQAKILERAYREGEIVEADSVRWAGLYSSSISYVPVVRDGKVLAVISREANMSAAPRQAGTKGWATAAADVMLEMVSEGTFPDADSPTSSAHGVPRVIDGAILLDPEGKVVDISPNANSLMRRLGVSSNLVGSSLIEATTEAMVRGERIEETMAVVLAGKAPWRVDVTSRGVTVAMRAIPLLRAGERAGAVILTRDVTDMRRHEQELMTKDATIREIHHRVKNNLQTVSALLRMQERRSTSKKVREALQDAGRRVQSIATVHDSLAQNVNEVVDFDEVAPRILNMAAQVATATSPVRLDVSGNFGVLGAEQASALATVLAELISNAAQHGTPRKGGTVSVRATRSEDELKIVVEDQGKGGEDGKDEDFQQLSRGLGTQIVQAMVAGELGGSITWSGNRFGGTVADLRFNPQSAGRA